MFDPDVFGVVCCDYSYRLRRQFIKLDIEKDRKWNRSRYLGGLKTVNPVYTLIRFPGGTCLLAGRLPKCLDLGGLPDVDDVDAMDGRGLGEGLLALELGAEGAAVTRRLASPRCT